MRAFMGGRVVAVSEPRNFTRRDGSVGQSVDVFFAPDDPRFAPERVGCPLSLAPTVGEVAYYAVRVSSGQSQRGPWMNASAVSRVDMEPKSLPAPVAKPVAAVRG